MNCHCGYVATIITLRIGILAVSSEFDTDSNMQFDYCTKQKDFSTVVVQAAATSPTLHNAILAVTAKFLSVTRDFDRFTPDRYQLKCLRTLIPALTAPEAVLDENLFAATVILRFFDEMTGISVPHKDIKTLLIC